jgi:hypothetical protein
VRTCDGFFFPISYSTYAGRLSEDANMCQANCAAPSELYVYRTGGDIAQAISLNGTAYADLPNAFTYRKAYVKGCSCKQSEYNPTEIEAAARKAEATPAPGKPGKRGKKQAGAPAAAPAPAQPEAAAAPAAAPAPEAQNATVIERTAPPPQ